MEVCTGTRYTKHDEIVYNEINCPLCRALEDLENEKKMLEDSADLVDSLERECLRLQKEKDETV